MASFGNKADNLKKLSDAGFAVPKFYVIDNTFSKKIQSSNIKKALTKDFISWKSKYNVSSVAVRSSSTSEDSKEHSFAGQFETVLDVQTQIEFVDSLTRIFNSKEKDGYVKNSGQMNIIIQEFIEPDVSGVIFSVNPSNGNNELVINAAMGRGTNVVEGSQAEQYFVSRLDPNNYMSKSEGVNLNVLTKAQINTLASITMEVESLFIAPQDIEWAIKDDTVYVLQSRPITAISHLRLWDSSNISESFPGIVLPLTFSIAKRGYLLGYKAQAYAGGLSWYELEAQHRNFDSMIGIFNGKMYYNLLSWYRYITLFPGSKKNQQFLDDQIATQGQAIYQVPGQLTLTNKIRYTLRLVYRVLFFKRELARFYNRFSDFEAKLKRMPQAGDSQLLMAQYAFIEQTIIPQFGRTLDNDFLVMTYHGLLKKLLNKWLPDQPVERNNIIGSIGGVMSAKQALSLYALAEKFREDAQAYELLKTSDYFSLDSYLQGSSLQEVIQEYIDVFGHRFAEDQKIESINPTLEQYGIYKLMEVYVQLDSAQIAKRLAKTTINSLSTEGNIKNQLRYDRRIIYSLLLRKLKHHLRLREKNRLLRGKVYGYMRELFPKVGQAFVDEGVIGKKDDVYYLQIEEIYQLMQGALITNDLADRVKARRKAYKDFANIDMPERFITKGLPSLEKVESVDTSITGGMVKDTLSGLISSPGNVEGRVVVLSEPRIPKEPYDILVAKHTDPGWTPLIALAKGVIVEHGGMLSHAAIVTRELGIPSIIGVKNVTSILKTGMHVRINTQTSRVEIIES